MRYLAGSPCNFPDLTLDEMLAVHARLGFRACEIFTGWARSAVDIEDRPAAVRGILDRYGMRVSSLHLPVVDAADLGVSLARAQRAAGFAAEIGAPIVLVKASDRTTYARAAPALVDAASALGLTPVLQNHSGSALTTLDDICETLRAIADRRLAAVLEVGHLHTAGVPWPRAWDAIGTERIRLIHVKDQIGPRSVPYGAGEIDLPGLLRRVAVEGWRGAIVVEMEVEDRANTEMYLRDALEYLAEHGENGKP